MKFRRALQMVSVICLIILGVPALFEGSHGRVEAATCPGGTVAITGATRAAATAAGIPTSAECWSPNDPNAGMEAGTAKAWLRQHATGNSNIACMNAQFAEKLMKFMQAVPGGTPTITDGYRDPGKQASLVASGASKAGYCQSYHNYGLAADFTNNTKAQTAWMRANSKSYGINTIGTWDPNHFQDGSGIHGQCGSCANTGAGANGSLPSVGGSQGTSGPDDIQPYTPSTPGQCDAGYVSQGSQCVLSPTANQPQSSQQSAPQSSGGGQASTPASTQSPSATTPLTASSTSNTLLASLMNGSGLNAIPASSIVSNLFNALSGSAAPATSSTQTTQTTSTITLNGDTSNVVTIVPGSTNTQSTETGSQGGTVVAGTTFTSSDLQSSVVVSSSNSSFASTIQSTLASIKGALGWITSKVSSLL